MVLDKKNIRTKGAARQLVDKKYVLMFLLSKEKKDEEIY